MVAFAQAEFVAAVSAAKHIGYMTGQQLMHSFLTLPNPSGQYKNSLLQVPKLELDWEQYAWF